MAYKNVQDKRDYQNKWARENRKTHQAYVKATKDKFTEKVDALKMFPCMDCGFVPEYAVQMDWDHITDNKLMGVTRLRNVGSWQKVIDEIAKCELVCANCHRKRTLLRRRSSLVGTTVS